MRGIKPVLPGLPQKVESDPQYVKYQTQTKATNKEHEVIPNLQCNQIIIPNFITNGSCIHLFFLNIQQNLENFPVKPEYFKKNIDKAKLNAEMCYRKSISMYKYLASIMLEFETQKIQDNKTGLEESIKKIQNEAKRKLLEEFIKVDEEGKQSLKKSNIMKKAQLVFKEIDKDLLQKSNFQKFLNDLTMSIIELYQNLTTAMFFIFQSYKIKSPGSDLFTQLLNYSSKKSKKIQGVEFLNFLLFRKWFMNNITEGFGNLPEICNFNDFVSDESLLMPIVFYEYYVFNNDNIDLIGQNQISFHKIENIDTNFKTINLISINGEKANISSTKTDDHLFYIGYKMSDKKEIYPNFQFYSISNSDYTHKIKTTNITAYYYPKKTGNTSQGFSVHFKNSNTKYFFKELYCLSERFKFIHSKRSQYVSSSDSAFRSYGLKVRKEECFFIDGPICASNTFVYSSANSNLYHMRATGPYKKSDSQNGINLDHVNEYVELSGYFLLELFRMIPSMSAFYSEFFGKPIIKVNGIDESIYSLVSSINERGEVSRIDFQSILYDINAVYISSIPIMKLRLIQIIFLIDDFHEGNLAVSFKTKKYTVRNKKVGSVEHYEYKFIKDIQAIDIWPSYLNLKNQYIFETQNLSQFNEYISFDDQILNILDLKHKSGKLDLLYNCDDDYYINRNINCETITKADYAFYGQRIKSFQYTETNGRDKRSPYRVIAAYYAMLDLIDAAYKSYPDIFSGLDKNANICSSIVTKLLNKTYEKCTKETKALNELFINKEREENSPEDNMNNENELLAKHWEEYVENVAKTTISIISYLSPIFSYAISDQNFTKIISVQSEYVLEEYSFYEFNRLFDSMQNSMAINEKFGTIIFGLCFIGNEFQGEKIDFQNILERFGFRKEAQKQIAQLYKVFKTMYIFLFDSPLKFDLVRNLVKFDFQLFNANKKDRKFRNLNGLYCKYRQE